jgi:MFS family permease
MCGQLDPAKNITITSEYTEFNWGKVTHKLTMTFPICQECKRIHDRLKFANTAGYVVGVLVGGGLAAVIYEATGKPKNAWWWIILLVLIVMTVFNVLATSLVLKNVPKEKHAFYSRIGEDKGIRLTFNAKEGFVAIGFLSRDFATAFQQSNSGLPTEV